MKNVFKGLAALSLAFVLSACGAGKKDSANESKDAADVSAKLTVQVEEAWLPHYEQAANRVKEKYPNADIEFKKVSAFDHLDILDSTDATNEDVADLFASVESNISR